MPADPVAPARVDELLALGKKATERPWQEISSKDTASHICQAFGGDSVVDWMEGMTLEQTARDAAFIVAAANLVVPLAEDWKRLREAAGAFLDLYYGDDMTGHAQSGVEHAAHHLGQLLSRPAPAEEGQRHG